MREPVQIQARQVSPDDLTTAASAAPAGKVVKATDIDVFDLGGRPLGSTKLGAPITIEIQLTNEDIRAIGDNLTNLEVMYFSEVSGIWEKVSSTVDLNRREVVATADHFSLFAVVIPQPAGGGNTWLWLGPVLGVLTLAAATALLIRRRAQRV